MKERGVIYRQHQVGCASTNCCIFMSGKNREALLVNLKKGRWEHKLGKWTCREHAGWMSINIKEGTEEYKAIKKIRGGNLYKSSHK